VDEATWFAVTAALTALGGAWTWYALRHRGLASGVRGAAITLLFPAMFLTDTTETVAEIGESVFDWATGLVLSPLVWIGLLLFGLSAVLFVVSGFLRNRAAERVEGDGAPGAVDQSRPQGALPPSSPRSEPVIDDELAEIEAILKKRGIT
jgi:hypothetical protein